MFGRRNQLKTAQDAYNKQIQDFNQSKWEEPIALIELIFSDYDDLPVDGGDPKKIIVFIDTNYDLDWITSYSLDAHTQHLVNDIMVMTSLPYKHFTKEKQLSFLRILGQGIVAALSNNDDDVRMCREQASSFHRQISLDVYKNVRLKIATFILAAVIISYNVVIPCVQFDAKPISAALWGFIGAYLSICYKNGKNESTYSINTKFVFWDIVGRFVLGSICGIIANFFTNSCLLNIDSCFRTKENISILAMIAGFSENVIPNLMGKYENKFLKGE